MVAIASLDHLTVPVVLISTVLIEFSLGFSPDGRHPMRGRADVQGPRLAISDGSQVDLRGCMRDPRVGRWEMGWLHGRGVDAAAVDSNVRLGLVVRERRRACNLTQAAAADVLNTSQSRLSKIESGAVVVRDVRELRFIAERLGIPVRQLGLLSEEDEATGAVLPDGVVGESQRRWLEARRVFTGERAALTSLVVGLCPGVVPVEGTEAVTCAGWIPDGPVPLGEVGLAWQEGAPGVGGGWPVGHVLPLRDERVRYVSYSRALRDVCRPTLLDNRPCYRLVAARWDGEGGELGFGMTGYFDVIDVCEAVGHEFAAAYLANGRKAPSMDELPLRAAIGDPFDLTVRPMYTSINTLTIRRSARGGHRFYLHNRDPRSVASGGGAYGVMPAGCFQPSSVGPARQVADFSLWRNIQREFSEEFLGNPEHDGQESEPIDYAGTEPFRSMDRLREQGRFVVYAFGTVLDPLALFAEQLTVAVLDADAFDELFLGMVAVNDEGEALSTRVGDPAAGIPFTREALVRLRDEPLSPVARACLALAWKHRRELVG